MKKRFEVFGKEVEIEVTETPIFEFVCPRCKRRLYKGVVDWNLEEWRSCANCGWKEESWLFPHTLCGSNLWTVGGHYGNDPPVALPIETVLEFFFWCVRDKAILVHGCEPHVLGTLKECIEALRKAGYLEE